MVEITISVQNVSFLFDAFVKRSLFKDKATR
jgi:hypothetical protein